MQKMYLMGETNYYPDSMRLKEAFRIAGTLYPNFDQENTKYLMDAFELNPEKKVKALSTGMSSMFRLIMAFSVGTPYVFLDEPILGLDAVHREMFYKLLIEQFEKRPACYVISTHLIEEVANLIENVIIIDSGKILLQEETETLLARGYTVTGPEDAVNDFIKGHNCIGQNQLGGMKSAYILEKFDKEQVPETLEVSNLKLQQLFVQLAKGDVENDFS
jgi:ABC-2 type transport system ATP-binding protein